MILSLLSCLSQAYHDWRYSIIDVIDFISTTHTSSYFSHPFLLRNFRPNSRPGAFPTLYIYQLGFHLEIHTLLREHCTGTQCLILAEKCGVEPPIFVVRMEMRPISSFLFINFVLSPFHFSLLPSIYLSMMQHTSCSCRSRRPTP